MAIVVFLLATLVAYVCGEYEELILSVHNDYRRDIGASDMNKLVVWSKTTKIGCSMHVCENLKIPELKKSYSNAWFFGCWYTPRANVHGQFPYDLFGEVCSKCAAGRMCEDGLCAVPLPEEQAVQAADETNQAADETNKAADEANQEPPTTAKPQKKRRKGSGRRRNRH